VLSVLLTLSSSAFASWQIEKVDGWRVGWDISIALDRLGHPHISYYDWLNSDLKYAKWDGQSWQIEKVDTEGYVGSETSIAIDNFGDPHISYYGNNDLKYAKWDGTTWHIQIVDSVGKRVGWHTSIALDSLGHPHISYFSVYEGLKYAKWDGTNWQIETVDTTALGYTSIALDKLGYPHIGYYAGPIDFSTLKYAKFKPTGVKETEIQASKEFILTQNYPNPSSRVVAIDYKLPYKSKVSLKIYDLQGRLVSTLVNSEKGAGYHSVKLNLRNLLTGVYFYRLEANVVTLTKKFIVVR